LFAAVDATTFPDDTQRVDTGKMPVLSSDEIGSYGGLALSTLRQAQSMVYTAGFAALVVSSLQIAALTTIKTMLLGPFGLVVALGSMFVKAFSETSKRERAALKKHAREVVAMAEHWYFDTAVDLSGGSRAADAYATIGTTLRTAIETLCTKKLEKTNIDIDRFRRDANLDEPARQKKEAAITDRLAECDGIGRRLVGLVRGGARPGAAGTRGVPSTVTAPGHRATPAIAPLS
jgi:hypothetical protein